MKDVDNIKRVVKDIRYLIATDCCDETIEARIENYIAEGKGQSLPIDHVIVQKGTLVCEHPLDKRASVKSHGKDFCWKCGEHITN